ncbi:protein-glutamine gamma-glutamyltransferase [Bacillus cereus]|uniref:protein-glutamine gamma-glutamyltransferase n=1 Tax=Bacillus cereus TaxID=1396 RepID=UPI0005CED826|nr:protein-glutamine gamma-glutamyltransferase [Bacillus cereus]
MIQLLRMPFRQKDMCPSSIIKNITMKRLDEDLIIYSHRTIDELSFELKLREKIILSARAMNQSNVQFATFAKSRCNPQYWYLMNTGGFLLRDDVKPSDAIQDIYMNSSQYAFECATAKVIIYYHAILHLVGEYFFNQLFPHIYLYSWHFNPNLGLKTIYTNHFSPGDVVYFSNPDFHPQTPWWIGENAVVLEDGRYFGHGLGIKTAEQMIHALNQKRKPSTTQSAYLTNLVTRPDFIHLAKISMLQRNYVIHKYQHLVINHNESSISFDRYSFFLNTIYNNIDHINYSHYEHNCI